MSEKLDIKYRPKNFSEVLGQDSIVAELEGVVDSESYKVMNSVILAGSSGGGKTTIARIFAKAINCIGGKDIKPCNACEHCIQVDNGTYPDYREFDATSYSGVKEIEPLKELARRFPSVKGGTRIIYLDEAHALSKQAWDKLLKDLEEAHNSTLWVFATTQLHSVAPAVVTRSQVFKVKPIRQDKISEELQRICTVEKIKIKEEVLTSIARVNRHSMREAITTLDKYYKAYGKNLSKVDISVESDEDKILSILSMVASEGVIKATIELDVVDISTKDFSKVLTNVLLALHIYDSTPEELLTLGVDIAKVEVFTKQLKDRLPLLLKYTMAYNFDTLDKVKLYLLVIKELLIDVQEKVTEDLDKAVSEKEDTEKPKRHGVRVTKKVVNRSKKKISVKRKLKKKIKKPKKSLKGVEVTQLLDLGFSED